VRFRHLHGSSFEPLQKLAVFLRQIGILQEIGPVTPGFFQRLLTPPTADLVVVAAT
jgi:hypothetical protein